MLAAGLAAATPVCAQTQAPPPAQEEAQQAVDQETLQPIRNAVPEPAAIIEEEPPLPEEEPAPVGPPALPLNAENTSPVLPGDAPTSLPAMPGAPQDSLPPGLDFFDDSAQAAVPGDALNFEKTDEQIAEENRQKAFEAALQGLLPLRPEEIRELLEHFDRTQESVELPVYPNPKPEVAVETVSLDPGAAPVIVKTAYGNVTTLAFLDATGAPWPIEDISWAGNFEVVEAAGQQGSHIIRISPQSEFGTGNMSIRLLTLQTPVIISLETSRDIVHYRFDAIIPENGPMAETPLIDNGTNGGISIAAGDKDISSILQGVAPKDAKRLDVAGTDGRTSAYLFKEITYLRTPLTLLSPTWSASVASADGMRVYAMQNAPVVLLSDKGKMVRVRLSEREDLLDEQ